MHSYFSTKILFFLHTPIWSIFQLATFFQFFSKVFMYSYFSSLFSLLLYFWFFLGLYRRGVLRSLQKNFFSFSYTHLFGSSCTLEPLLFLHFSLRFLVSEGISSTHLLFVRYIFLYHLVCDLKLIKKYHKFV